ncbi:hypothetical protein [Nostoc sp. NMS7]|uniref:hypothetical protein n=1 Tax=Nostoc sp. NMS7 TaxID=2815391 RepID=UPI0025DEA69A|nr:hypothetical protein [Nostoc sp. NMS7]
MAKLQLHFNGSFAFKKDEINRLIHASAQEKGLNDSLPNLMEKTSLGNGKVGRVKSWAVRAGLIKNNRPSREGEIVLRLDSGLESNITDWLMHFYLSFGDKGLQQTPENPADWGGWSYFIYKFLPRYSKFTSEELLYPDYLFTGDIWQSHYPFLEATGRDSQARKTFVDSATPATSTQKLVVREN